MRRIIDLTLTLREGMRGVQFETKYTLDQNGWNARTLHLYSHCATHMDAPPHFGVPGGGIDELPLAHCMGRAWVIDVRHVGPKGFIRVRDLETIAGRLAAGESLLFRTDWARHWDLPDYYRNELPRISEELALWCVEHQVRMLGVEPPSVADVNNLEEVTRIHKLLLSGGVTIVEGLTNLSEIEMDQVFFCAFPLKIHQGDGAPCRAMAFEGTTDPLNAG